MSPLSKILQRLRGLPQLLQFAVVGGAAAATHLAVVWVLVASTGMAPLAANVLAFLVAFIVSYNGHALLTFSAAQVRGWGVVVRFFAVACLSFVVNEVLYAAALRWLPWHYVLSLALVLVLILPLTYWTNKRK